MWDTDIPFFFVSKTSWRWFQDTSSGRLQDISSRQAFKTCLQDVFKTCLQDKPSRHVFKTSSRHVVKMSSRHVFQTSSRHVFKTSSGYVFKTSIRRLCKTSSRRLQDILEDENFLHWRRLEEQQMFAGLIVIYSLDTLKKSLKKKETSVKKKIFEVLQQDSYHWKRTGN